MAEHRPNGHISCPTCRTVMPLKETSTHPLPGGPAVEYFECGDCGRKAALMFEPGRDMTPEEDSWVMQEIARHGYFFPSDHGGAGGRGGRGF